MRYSDQRSILLLELVKGSKNVSTHLMKLFVGCLLENNNNNNCIENNNNMIHSSFFIHDCIWHLWNSEIETQIVEHSSQHFNGIYEYLLFMFRSFLEKWICCSLLDFVPNIYKSDWNRPYLALNQAYADECTQQILYMNLFTFSSINLDISWKHLMISNLTEVEEEGRRCWGIRHPKPENGRGWH